MAGERRKVKPTAVTRSEFAPGGHRLGLGDRGAQRLLAQHVLARGQQGLDDLTVQVVGDHDAHRVDVGRVGDGVPVRLGACVAVPPGGVAGERLMTSAMATSRTSGKPAPKHVVAHR